MSKTGRDERKVSVRRPNSGVCCLCRSASEGRGERGSLHTRARRGRAHRLPSRCGCSLRVFPFLMVPATTTVHTPVEAFGFRREPRGRVGANDELCVPDTRTRQSAANAVLKSASKNCENVGEPGSLAMTKRRGRDGHDSLRDAVVKRSRCLELEGMEGEHGRDTAEKTEV